MTTLGGRLLVGMIAAATCLGFLATEIGHAETPLVAGSNSLLFRAIYDFQLSSFSGSSISLKHHTSQARAWRIGLGIGFGSGTEEFEELYAEQETVRDWKQQHGSLNATIERLWYVNPEEAVTLFFGGGPSIRYSWSDTENRVEAIGPGQIGYESRSSSLGLVLAVGVEWFPHDQIGILAQYGTDYMYSWNRYNQSYRDDEGIVRDQRRKTVSGDLSADEVRLGICAYW